MPTDNATIEKPPRHLMPPDVRMGPRPPRPAGFDRAMMEAVDRQHADTVRVIAQRMIWGERAADITGDLARQAWSTATSREPSPFDVETFRWLRELGETPDTPEGVVTLLRLADMTEWQSFDQLDQPREEPV